MVVMKQRHQSVMVGSGVVIATIDRIDNDGTAWISIRGKHVPVLYAAKVTAAEIKGAVLGSAQAAFAITEDNQQAIFLGFLTTFPTPPDTDVTIDGRRTVITAEDEIVLRCGKASITLTKAGKVLVRGAYVSSRSSGVNRIKGGSVQIN